MISKNEENISYCAFIMQSVGKHPKPATLASKKEFKEWLKEYTYYLPVDAKLIQRVYHAHYGPTIPACKCGNSVTWRVDLFKYSTYCGPKCSQNNENTQHKRKQTNIERYGVEHGLQAESIKTKIKNTTKERYGVDNVSQSQEIKQAKIKTCNLNQGVDFPTQNQGVINTRRENNIIKYGNINILASEYGKNKTQQSLLKRFDRKFANQTHITPDAILKLEDKQWLYDQHTVKQQTLETIATTLGVNDTTVGKYMKKHNLVIEHFARSSQEKELADMLTPHFLDLVVNDRTIIAPQELDIVIPSKNIAIEFCGVLWHSEQYGKDKHYHETKYKKCKELGYQLITIFSDEWKNHKQKVINTLSHKLGIDTAQKVGARDTTIIELTKNQKKEFLDNFHIQGNCASSINYGLVHNNEMVAVLCFSVIDDNTVYLQRYATSANVRGGFTKLLAHFVKNNSFKEIITFADNRWSDGKLYESCGFILDKELSPDYSYSTDGQNRIHKFNFRHSRLPHILKQYDPQLSETENCNNNNILRIWDCGKKRYIKYLE